MQISRRVRLTSSEGAYAAGREDPQYPSLVGQVKMAASADVCSVRY
jgi:hypothetical protein